MRSEGNERGSLFQGFATSVLSAFLLVPLGSMRVWEESGSVLEKIRTE